MGGHEPKTPRSQLRIIAQRWRRGSCDAQSRAGSFPKAADRQSCVSIIPHRVGTASRRWRFERSTPPFKVGDAVGLSLIDCGAGCDEIRHHGKVFVLRIDLEWVGSCRIDVVACCNELSKHGEMFLFDNDLDVEWGHAVVRRRCIDNGACLNGHALSHRVTRI